MKSLTLGEELFHADRRTDITKLIIAFRNFTYAPKPRGLATQTKIVLAPCVPHSKNYLQTEIEVMGREHSSENLKKPSAHK
jgi:hypothetical protein